MRAFVLLLRCEVTAFIFYISADCKRVQKTAKECKRVQNRNARKIAQDDEYMTITRVWKIFFNFCNFEPRQPRRKPRCGAGEPHQPHGLLTFPSSLLTPSSLNPLPVRNVSEAPKGYAHNARAPREAKCHVTCNQIPSLYARRFSPIYRGIFM